MKKFLSTLTVIVGIAFTLAMTGIAPAQAITFNFGWNGNGGYSAMGSFSYDENTAQPTFSENGPGATQVLKSLKVSFFNPTNDLIAAYDNVVNGISTFNFLKFNFNTVTQEIFGSVDLGGEVAGDIYLQGTVNTNLLLFHVPQSGPDAIRDSNSGSISVQTVPEPTSFLDFSVFSDLGITVLSLLKP